MRSREGRLVQLRQDSHYDVLIVGAGINGIGTYHDLVLQGLKVLLIDRADYCSGASAASSHMVHGGLRYLENGEFRLVYEAVQERGRLLRNAPHLVKPLPTVFPIFKRFSGLLNAPLKLLGWRDQASERGALVIKLGLLLYDWFARHNRAVPRHIFYGRQASLERFPALSPEILYSATYYDAAMHSPERLAMEVLLDAQTIATDSLALNYLSLQSATGAVAILRNELSGEEIEVRPQVLVNAAGPWVDAVNQAAGKPSNFIGGTKGSHLVLDHPALRTAIGENEFFFENEDGRIVLIFPLEDRVLVGTSDIRIENPDEAVITEDEVDYFFGMVKRVFPAIELNRNHIVFTFSGVRPLPQNASDSTGQISRDHKIEVLPATEQRPYPIYSLIGGKWTTFRAFAELASNQVLAYLALERRVGTARLAIGGGEGFPVTEAEREDLLAAWQGEFGCSWARASTLLTRYGTRASELLAAGDGQPLKHFSDYSRGEIEFLLREEDVAHLSDVLLRRTMLGMLGRITAAGLREMAEVVADSLGWAPALREEQIETVEKLLANKHRMHFNRYFSETRDEAKEVMAATQT